MTENEKKNNEIIENEKNNSSGSVAEAVGGFIGGTAGAFLGGPIGGVAGAALGSFIGKIFGSDNRTIEDEAKAFDNIAQAIKPMYSGDFDKALDSIRNYRNKNVHNNNEDGIYINPKYFENAKRFVEYFKYSQKPLPPENSEYDNALKYWEILNNNDSAKQCFLASIEKESETRIDAIKDYIDFLFATEDEKTAAITLEEYKKNYSQSKPLLEKAVSLYSQTGDSEKLYENLLALSELKPNDGTILLRLADCEYRLGMFEKSIETARKALAAGCWIFGYANQVVESYIALKQYDKAREFVDKVEARFGNELKKIEKTESYEIHSLDIPFYFRDRIDSAEKNKENSGLFALDNDNFIQKRLVKRYVKEYKPINEYELKIIRQKIDDIYKHISGYWDTHNDPYYYQLSSEYLSAAYIVKHLYGKTMAYYSYLSEGLFYYGVSARDTVGYDVGKNYILSALKSGFMIEHNSMLETSINNVYLGGYTGSTDILKEFDLKSTVLMAIVSAHYNDYLEHISDDECRLFEYSPVLRSNLSGEDEKHVLDEVDKRFVEANKKYNTWLSAVEKDVDFKADLKDAANAVKDSVLTFKSDKELILKYLDSISKMKEFYKYDDFDNRILILSQVSSKLDALESNIRENDLDTIFFENYLEKVISATRNNLNTLIDRTKKDFATKITIDVPITKVTPNKSGNISLSVSISNKENRAPAKNMQLFVENTDKETIFHKNLSSKNLKGGTAISEQITISSESRDAFSIKIRVSYKGGAVEKSVQITVDSAKFEKIRNDYNTGNPVVKDDMFFGRDKLIERLATSLKDDTTRCVIIYGQKRSGKSSIFRHLRKKLEDKFVILFFPTIVDVKSEIDFYEKFRNEFTNYLRCNKFDTETRKKWKDYTILNYSNFEQFIYDVYDEICEPQNKELLLMIDEFTGLYENMKKTDCTLGKENFMDIWKAMSEQNLFKSALIGQDNMPEFIRAYPNQFQVTEPIRVSYLEKEYAIKLITEPILLNGESRYYENSAEKIYDWFKGQPYYTQTYCKKLVDYLNSNEKKYVAMASAEEVKKMMLEDVGIDFFDNLVNEKDENSWSVLKKIAKSNVEDVSIDKSSLNDSEKEALKKLTDREVLAEKQDSYKIKIPFFREWIREYK